MDHPAAMHAYASRQSQGGLSLVELMISITIGLLILSAMATLFSNQSRTRSELDKSNRMIDNGRYALEVLSENLRVAGFYGSLSPPSASGALPNPCSTTMSEIAAAVPVHIQGYDAADAAVDVASPPSCAPATSRTGSDILVIRRVDASAPVAQTAAVSGTPYLQASQCQYDSPATPYKVDNVPANFTLRQKNCTTTSTTPYAELRRMRVQVYYVDSSNHAGDGIPTLKRIELDSTGALATVPLAEGIEYLQVEYGIDGDSNGDGAMDDINGDGLVNTEDLDGAPDSYVENCADIACWNNAVAVKLYLVARNIEQTAGYSDTRTYGLGQAGSYTPSGNDAKYKRHAYTQLVRLVNPASRREAP